MNYYSLCLWLCFSAVATAQTIPIESVWSNGIKGTREIRELDPQHREVETVHEYPTLNDIGRLLIRDRKRDQFTQFLPAQAVPGEGTAALLAFRDYLKSGKEPPLNDENVSLIFFTDLTSTYVVFDSIERKGDLITVNYHHQTHSTMEMDWYIAIIPLGKLPAGEFRVNIHRNYTLNSKGERPSTNLLAEQIVCRGTAFQVHAR